MISARRDPRWPATELTSCRDMATESRRCGHRSPPACKDRRPPRAFVLQDDGDRGAARGGRLTLRGCPRVQGSPVGRTLDVQVPPLERNPRAPASCCSSSLEPTPQPLRVPRRRVRHRHRSVARRPHGLPRPAALPRASSRARSVAGCGPCSPHEPAAGAGLGVTPGYTCPRPPLPDVAMRGRLGQQGSGSARCPRRLDLLV